MADKKILLTGFGPFPGVPVNPTGQLMERIADGRIAIAGAKIDALTLPTAYSSAKDLLEKAAADFLPDAIISFGVATKECNYRIERIAANLDDCHTPDICNAIRRQEIIAADGPPHYFGNLKLGEIENAFRSVSIPVRYSDSAGNYVCNHVFYSALHWCAIHAPSCRVGFIHVPDPAHAPDWHDGGYMATLRCVLSLTVEAVIAEINKP